jgi:hypothetical protein
MLSAVLRPFFIGAPSRRRPVARLSGNPRYTVRSTTAPMACNCGTCRVKSYTIEKMSLSHRPPPTPGLPSALDAWQSVQVSRTSRDGHDAGGVQHWPSDRERGGLFEIPMVVVQAQVAPHAGPPDHASLSERGNEHEVFVRSCEIADVWHYAEAAEAVSATAVLCLSRWTESTRRPRLMIMRRW